MLEADAKLIILYLFFVRKMTGDVFAAWNDCSSAEMEKIIVQVQTSRIVTRISLYGVHRIIFLITEWDSLAKRWGMAE